MEAGSASVTGPTRDLRQARRLCRPTVSLQGPTGDLRQALCYGTDWRLAAGPRHGRRQAVDLSGGFRPCAV